MKKMIQHFLLALVLLCSVIVIPGCNTVKDSVIDSVLVETANQINAQCPMTIDSDTRLDNTSALPGKVFQYNYTLVNYSKSKMTDSEVKEIQRIIQDELRPFILNGIKSSSEMKALKDYGVTFKYVYKTSDGFELSVLTIKPSEYK